MYELLSIRLLDHSPLAIRHSPRLIKALLHHRFEGRIEKTLHQRVRGIVGATGLALVACRDIERKGWRINVEIWVQFEQ